jgi:hypothetical protein
LKNLHLVVSWLPVLEKVDSDKHTNTSAISFSNHEGASVFKYHALLNDFFKINI